ncbi:MAG: molybdopterin adenylyltransferase [Thermoplasmata archaeon]|jgi:molybdenum cofactor biosynthesis protein B|nr:molybdopterin adenylyltransferase [Thermoplasmata archaeon]
MSDAVREHKQHAPARLRFALVTMSDSRSAAQDASGEAIAQLAKAAGHDVAHRALVRDEPAEIRAAFEAMLSRDDVDVVVGTGGTGLAPRDVTPETVAPLLERDLPGFGELFRMLSFQEVGGAAMASRARAGVARGKLVFLLPGSTKACRLAMERLILPEAPHLVGLMRR